MKKLLFVLSLCLTICLLGCSDEGGGGDGGDPCEGVTCSDAGTCVVEAGWAHCECDAGFHADGLDCEQETCVGVDCSGHGACFVDGDGYAHCECDEGYHEEDLDCVEDDLCEDPAGLREEALTEGTEIFDGVSLPTSTPIADINANPAAYEGALVQIEGLVLTCCSNAGCWVTIDHPDGGSMNLKVIDGTFDFREATERGNYMIGEGIFTVEGEHGPEVYMQDHGAMVGSRVCPIN